MPNIAEAPPPPPPLAPSLYRAVWRWHFYAGLLVLPFLAWLAATGAAYLFHGEIDGWVHRDLLSVPAASAAQAALPHGRIVDAALAAHPGAQWFRYTPAPDARHSASVGVALPQGGERIAVYLDPATARVLGELPERGTLMWTVRQLHSLKYFGPVARGFMEMAAGWALVLVATGLYLWWPRGGQGGGRGGVLSVRGRPAQRVFWRDLHAVTGVGVGLVLAFLAATGLPWSVLWGGQVNAWANGKDFGYPAGVRVQLPMSGQRLADAAHVPWTLQQARVPGNPHEGHAGHEGHGGTARAAQEPLLGTPLTVDAALAVIGRLGLAPGYTVTPPHGARGVFSASAYPDDLARQRVVHIDQYSGAVLLDQGYADYGPAGRALEWGINVHLGQQFGAVNQWALLVACAAIVLLCVTGAVAWWKRRPRGSGLGVPPLPARPEVLAGLTALLALGGAVFPLVGASLLVVLGGDLWWQRRLAKRAGAGQG